VIDQIGANEFIGGSGVAGAPEFEEAT